MLTVHFGTGYADLIEAAASVVLDVGRHDPLAGITVVMPGRAVADWFRVEVADRLGIAAGLRFLTPSGLLRHASAEDDGAEGDGATAWRVYDRLAGDGCPEEAQRYVEALRDRAQARYELAAAVEDTAAWCRRKDPGALDRLRDAPEGGWIASVLEGIPQGEALLVPARLPPVLLVFGCDLGADLRRLAEAAADRTVHVFLPAWCPAWAATDAAPGGGVAATLGASGRAAAAAALDVADDVREPSPPPPRDGATLLGRLQDLVRAGGASLPGAPDDDGSFRVHACHSAMREAQVLRDLVLDLSRERPDISCDDILVLLAQPSVHGPLVEGVFRAAGGPEASVRVPGAAAGAAPEELFGAVLDAAASRWEAPVLLDLLRRPEVAAAFGMDGDDVAAVASWLRDTGVRWGLDAAHRAELGLPGGHPNTWASGLDRLMLGYAAGGDVFWGRPDGDVQAHGGIEGAAEEVLGRFAGFVAALGAARERLAGEETVDGWCGVFREIVGAFVGRSDEDGAAAARDVLFAAIDAARRDAEAAGMRRGVPWQAAAAAVRRSAGGLRPSPPLLRGVRVLPLSAAAGLPARAVVVVGLDDGVPTPDPGPRLAAARGATDAPDGRAGAGRLAVLAALMSAREVFACTFVGQHVGTNRRLPPSSALSALLDACGGDPDRLVVRHPLQPHSARYADGTDPRLVTYAPEAWAPASPSPIRRFADVVLPDPGPLEEVSLSRLTGFLANAPKHFMVETLGIRFPEETEDPEDCEPFDVVDRHRGGLVQQAAQVLLDGGTAEAARRRIAAAHALPHGVLGDEMVAGVVEEAEAFAQEVAGVWGEATIPEEVLIDLAGVRVSGRVPSRTTGLVRIAGGKPSRKTLLRLWIDHVAMCAAGRASESRAHGTAETVVFGALEPAWARSHLAAAAEAYALGRTRPLPIFQYASDAFASSFAEHGDEEKAVKAARAKWDGNPWTWAGERATCPYLSRVYEEDDDPLDSRFVDHARAFYLPFHERRGEP